MTAAKLHIDHIRRDGGTQMRVSLNEDATASYAERIEAGDEFPPIVVFDDNGSNWLADGFHRVDAHARLRSKYIGTEHEARWSHVRCDVRSGTLEDAKRYAISANKTNGLRRTNADKAVAVRAALEHPALKGMSDRAIANEVGVSAEMIRQHRAGQVPTVGTCDPKPAARRGKDGKSYKVTSKPKLTSKPKTTPSPAVTIHTGIDAADRADTVPHDQWPELIEARRMYCRNAIIDDCRLIIQFASDAETVGWLGFDDRDQYIREGLGIDPDVVEWAERGLELIDDPSPFDVERALAKINLAVIDTATRSPQDRDWIAHELRQLVETVERMKPNAAKPKTRTCTCCNASFVADGEKHACPPGVRERFEARMWADCIRIEFHNGGARAALKMAREKFPTITAAEVKRIGEESIKWTEVYEWFGIDGEVQP